MCTIKVLRASVSLGCCYDLQLALRMNGVDPLLWPILLLLVGCVLAMLEVFLPSGGILGFSAAAAVFSSIGLAFLYRGMTGGVVFTAVALVAVPGVIAVALRYWPETPMGKRILLGLPTDEEVLPLEHKNELRKLVGQIGTATCPMLPSGAVQVGDRIVDAVSQGMSIDQGQKVKIIEARTYRVVVRPVEEGDEQRSEQPDDLLSRPLEELGLEPLDDPLA